MQASAQSLIATPPQLPTPLPQVAQEDLTNNVMNVFIPSGVVNNSDLPQWLQYGPFNLRPHVDASISYGDGIQSQPGHSVTSAVWAFSPGLTVDLGKHWTLDYTPTFRYYSSSAMRDEVDHSLSLSGQTHYEDWSLGLSQTFVESSSPIAQTGTQTDQQHYGTDLTASRLLNDDFSADFGLSQKINTTGGLQNSRDWSTMDWLNYQIWPRLNVGIGGGGGFTDLDVGSDQTYEDVQARINWRATDKISFQVSGGGEDRQFMTGNQSALFNPIFSGSIQYLPAKNTQISLTGSRSVGASDYYIISQVTETTSVAANLNQRMFKKYRVNLGASYTKTENTVAISVISQNRTDEYVSYSASISRDFLRHGTWSIFYQYNDNRSSLAGYSVHGGQVGTSISYRF